MDRDEARAELERLRLRVRALEQIVGESAAPPGAAPVAFALEAREKLLSEAEQLAHMGSFAWDVPADVIHWSDELHRILGHEPGSVVPSQELFFAAIDARDRERVQAVARRGVATGISEPVDFRVVAADGSTRHVHMMGDAVLDAAGRPTRFVGAILDVTERVQLEAQVLQSHKMEALGRLAGGMAHDFNNLLTVIGVHVALLRRRRDAVELAEVAAAVERAADLTRQLLAFGRQAVFEPRRIEPGPIVRDALCMAQRIVGEHVAMSIEAAPDLGKIEIDPSHLAQVVMNLVINASDALRPGGRVAVRIATETVTDPPDGVLPAVEPGDHVVLEVSDDGIGMDAQVQRRLFDPFFSTKKEGERWGLGLPLVFGVVSGARGGIVVQSVEGKGTTVRVYLPRVDAHGTPAPAATIQPAAAAEHRLLLVEDNGAIRRVLTTILEEAGFRVEAAADGEAALAIYQARSHEFAGVVTDVVMPGLGGPQLVRRLRAITPGLPVLYLSGYAREKAGIDDEATRGALLKKPFLPAELVQRVGELVGRGT